MENDEKETYNLKNQSRVFVLPEDETFNGSSTADLCETSKEKNDENCGSADTLDNLEPCGGLVGEYVAAMWKFIGKHSRNLTKELIIGVKLAFLVLFFVYVGFMIAEFINEGKTLDWCDGYGMGFLVVGLTTWCTLYYGYLKDVIYEHVVPKTEKMIPKFRYGSRWYFKYLLQTIIVIAFIIFGIVDATGDWNRIRSIFGVFFFVLLGIIFSKSPTYINWGLMVNGLCLQFVIGMFTIKTAIGRSILTCAANIVTNFLEYGYQGAIFVYGEYIVSDLGVFAFESLSVLYFLATVTSMLYHLGWIQRLCYKLGAFIQFFLGSTVIESVYCVSCVFLGMSEAPLIIATYLEELTESELFTVMTAGYATVAGTLLAAYTALGIEPKYVITASSMSAPASLLYSKLFYPETKKSKTSSDNLVIMKGNSASIVDAAAKGAMSAVNIVLSICATVIATVSIVAAMNGICAWFGTLIGISGLTVEYMLGVVLTPLAWIMGVEWSQCSIVGELIGLKSLANEFVAYEKLATYKNTSELSGRSEIIATFALCGFANPGSVASTIALLSSLCPGQSNVVTKYAVRSYVAGSFASFSNAAIAGLLSDESGY